MEEKDFSDQIAIIGMDCRLPGASNVTEFWNNLKEGKSSINEFSKEELLESGETLKEINDPNYVARRGIVDGVDLFDAAFFGFTPREAELLDPQHRLFLECCWHSLEDSGYAVRNPDIRVGVFGGAGTAWYLNDVYNNPAVKKYADSTSIVTGSDRDYLTTRVSYKLNLNGPSLDVQSACSTSMASIVLGVQSLLSYQSDMILAGGVSVQYPEKVGYLYVPGGLESADGVCRPFDKDANGTLFSRGCGVVLLKRLDDAIKDKDHIYAVIRSSSINNDGNKKVGYTAPSVDGQKEVIWEALELAEISADQITMVEAHGTATMVGDPIEVTSLTESFRQYTGRKQFCALGSVKSNIGHTVAASGVISVIKTVLSLKHSQIPASINYSEPNPNINFEESPFFVNQELRQWETSGDKRFALVNSFGVGGTNACVILEESPRVEAKIPTKKHDFRFMALSTMHKEVLDEYVDSIKSFVNGQPTVDVADLAYTSIIGRKHFNHRAFVTFKDRYELLHRLESPNWPKKGINKEAEKKVVFMFPGQGNQYLEMGQQLYEKYPLFKQTVDECAELLMDEVGMDIRKIIYPKENIEEAQKLIDQTFITQPVIYVISYAQSCLLRSWGVEPEYLMGHSIGEYVAATLAGVFTLKDALKAVAYRAKLVQELPGGAMCAVLLSEEEVLPMLKPGSSVGVINNPGLCVVSGPYSDIEELEAQLSEKKIFNKRIPTSHAFHSAMMDPMLEKFKTLFDRITLNAPKLPIISTVTGVELTDEQAMSADYWVGHVRETVRFSAATMTAMELSPLVFIEVGPGQSLESAVKRHLDNDTEHAVLSTMRTINMDIDDCEYLTTAIGNMWTFGVNVDFEKYFEGEDNRRIPFPLYPYNRKSYVVKRVKNTAKFAEEEEDTKNQDISQWVYLPSWKKTPRGKILLEQYLSKIAAEESQLTNSWLIFDEDFGLGEAIKNQLMAKNEEFTIVRRGAGFNKLDSSHYTINLSEKKDYTQLIAAILSDGKTPNRVIHLWNVEKNPVVNDYASCEAKEEFAYYSPLYLEQAFIEQNAIDDLNILFVANGVFSVAGESISSPLKALAIGPARCINSEMRQIFGKFVDVDSMLANTDLTAQQLIDEVQFRNNDNLIIFRKNTRWTEYFEKINYAESPTQQPIFRNDGVYLITGGTGGLGLEFAKHISEQAKATIILTYRTPLPPKNEWEQYIKDHPSDITTEKIKAILAIEAKGSTVHLFHAESNDIDQMRALKEFVEKEVGSLTGVIHSAGAAGGGIIALKTKEMSNDVLKAKTKGALIIDELFGIEELEFVIYFSSISSVLGESSRVDYSGANSFLDCYTFYRNQLKPGSTYSINWDSWSKVGMAARWEETQALTRKKLYLNEKSYQQGLHLISENEQEEIYQVGFDDKTDWVYKEHLVAGQYTVVGTSIIDLLAKFAKMKFEGKTPVISELYFLKPLYIKSNEHPNLRVYAMPENGGYKVNLSVLEITKTSDKWDVVATAFVKAEDSGSEEAIDIKNTLAEFNGEESDLMMFSEVVFEGKELLRYSDRWQNIHKKYKKADRYIIEHELKKEYIQDMNSFLVHPAILDTSVANLFSHYTNEPFLPFNYKLIKVHKPFTNHLYAIIDVVNELKSGSKMAVFDLKFYDEKGELILEAEKYSLVNIVGGQGQQTDEQKKPETDDDEYILPDEGTAVFDRIMHYRNDTNVIVTPYNLFRKIKDIKEDYKEEKVEDDNAATYDRPDLSTEYIAPSNEIEETVAKIWGQVLGIGEIGINDNFNELGGNSLLVVQAVSNISSAFNIQLPVDIFKDAVTVKSLSDYIMGLLVQDIDDAELDDLLKEIED